MKKTLTAIAILFALTSNANPIDSTKNVNIMDNVISIKLAQRAHFYRAFKQGPPACPMQYNLLHPGSASRQKRSMIISAIVFVGLIVAASSIKPQ